MIDGGGERYLLDCTRSDKNPRDLLLITNNDNNPKAPVSRDPVSHDPVSRDPVSRDSVSRDPVSRDRYLATRYLATRYPVSRAPVRYFWTFLFLVRQNGFIFNSLTHRRRPGDTPEYFGYCLNGSHKSFRIRPPLGPETRLVLTSYKIKKIHTSRIPKNTIAMKES